jgi:hypothetical protein
MVNELHHSNLSLPQPHRRDVHLVHVSEAVPRASQRLHQLCVVEPPGKRLVERAAVAGEEEILAVGRDLRAEVPAIAVDRVAEVARLGPLAVALVADVQIVRAARIGPAVG